MQEMLYIEILAKLLIHTEEEPSSPGGFSAIEVRLEGSRVQESKRRISRRAVLSERSGDENGDNYEGGNGGGNGNGVGNENGVGNRNGGVKENGGNRNGRGNGNGNDNGNSNGNGGGNGHNFRGLMHVARECTYQDFLKCQPLNFNGTEGVVRLTRWFEKMKTLLSEEPNSKDGNQLWNLTVKGNDLTTYTRRFQELVLLCTRMVPDEEDKVERFVGGLPDNIQGNVIVAEPTRL
ncbi:putative reverse transcriptase domain-containing protein [Tanacetum coccineum]